MLTDFQNYPTAVFSMKFKTKAMLHISPHFRGVTLLPCKTQRPKLAKFCCT